MYSNTKNLVKLLGIKKLPRFITQEPFDAPFEKELVDINAQQRILSKVNRYCQPPASTEELITVFELLKIGMHYVQHKTDKKVNRAVDYYDGGGADEFAFARDAYFNGEGWYWFSPKALAGLVDDIRRPNYGIVSQHKPTMQYSLPVSVVLAGAEEAHHAITYEQNRAFHNKNSNMDRYPIPYFKSSLELEFGKFLPQIVSDFGFEVHQRPILTKLPILKGELSEEEYKQLYRNRLERRYGFKLPSDDELKNREK